MAFFKKGDSNSLRDLVRSLLSRSDDGYVTIAPGVARRILDEANWPGQRKINPNRLAGKIRLIRAGEFDPYSSIIQFAELPNGEFYLIDGQHRLSAIFKTDIATKTMVLVVKARDLAHVRRLYAAIDSKESVRSQNEVLISTGVGEALGLKPQVLNAVFNSLPILLNGLEMAPNRDNLALVRDTQFRLSKLSGWEREAKRWQEITETAEGWLRKKMRQSAVTAAGMYTLRHNRNKAESFWKGVSENDGLRRNDPRARLIDDFVSRNLTTGSLNQALHRIAAAWNAHYDGRDLQRIKCHEASPVVFKGTPKAGGARATA